MTERLGGAATLRPFLFVDGDTDGDTSGDTAADTASPGASPTRARTWLCIAAQASTRSHPVRARLKKEDLSKPRVNKGEGQTRPSPLKCKTLSSIQMAVLEGQKTL